MFSAGTFGLVNFDQLRADTFIWTGGGLDDNFTTPDNWGGTTPPLGSSLLFSGSTRLTPTNDFAAFSNMAQVLFASGAGPFVVGGNLLSLQTNGADTPLIRNGSASLQTINLANLAFKNSGLIDALGGDLTLNLGSGSGLLSLDANSVLTLQTAAGKNLLINHLITNGSGSTGAVVISGAGTTTLAGDNTFGAGATGLTVSSGATVKIGNGGATGSIGSGALTNNGTVIFNRTGSTNLGAITSTAGSVVRVDLGTVNATAVTSLGSLASGNLVTVNSGATLNLKGVSRPSNLLEITIAGDGVGGAGALTNDTAGPAGNSGVRVLNLSANATVGGSFRYDIGFGGAGAINGNGFTLTKTGTNAMQLRAAATNLAGVIINQGTLGLEESNLAFGGASGFITVNNTATLGGYGELVIATPMRLNAGSTLTNLGSATQTWTGAVTLGGNTTISGSGTGIMISSAITQDGGVYGITKSGANLLTLAGANTFSGAIAVQGGTLKVSSLNSVAGGTASSNLGAPTTVANGTISLGSGGTQGILSYTGSGETTDRVINLSGAGGGATISQDGYGLLNFTSVMTATGSGAKGGTLSGVGNGQLPGIVSFGGLTNLTKSGIGTWTLTGASTQSLGAVNVNGGILAYGAASTRDSGPITRSSTGGGVLKIAAGAGVVTSTANTNGILGGWATFGDSSWAVANGASAITGLADASYVSDTWAAANNTDVTLLGADPAAASTTNTLRFNALGAKTLTLSGINTITTGGIMVTSAVGANLTTIAGGNLAGANTADLIIHQNNTAGGLTISSIIANNTGATGLTKTGPGLLTISGANTYTGNTLILEGILEATAKGAGNANYIVGENGTLRLGYSVGQSYSHGVTVNGSGASATTGLYLKGGTDINLQNGGGLVLSSGPTTVRTYGTGNAILSGYDSNGTHLTVNAEASGSSYVSTVTLAGGSYGYVMNIAAGAKTSTGDMTINGVLTGSKNYVKNGTGSLWLTGASTNTAAMDIRNGSVVLTGASNRLGTASSVIVGNGTNSGRLILDGISQTLTNLSNAGTGTANAVVGKSATLSTLSLNYAGAGQTYAGMLGGTGANENNLALAKSGAGTFTLSGTNTYTGGTTVSGGLLGLGSAGAVGTTGTLTLSGGGLQFTAANTTDYSSRIQLSDATTSTFDTNGQNVTFASSMALGTLGTGGFTKAGAGTLVVNSGAWKGATTVAGGTLEVLSKTNDVAYTVNAGATLKLGYSSAGGYTPALTVNGNGVADAAGLYLKKGINYQTNGGLLIQTAPTTINTYGTGGNAAIQGFDVNSAYFLRTAAAASGSLVDGTINVLTGSYGYKVQADLGASNATGDLTIAGVISGTGSAQVGGELIDTGLDKRGTGSLKLTNASTFAQGTSINDGAIILSGGANRLPATTTVVLGNGTASGRLVLGDSGGAVSQSVTGLLTNGTGTANAVVGGSAAESSLTVNNTTPFTYSGSLGGAGANENNFSFTKTGSSLLTLSGTNTYTGATIINGGSLLVNGSLTNSSILIGAGGTLGGSGGTVSGLVTTAAATSVISPGSSPGTLTIGSLDVTNGATMKFELGAVSDTLAVTGNITGGGTLIFNFSDAGGWASSTPYTLITFGSQTGLDIAQFVTGSLPGGAELDATYGTGGYQIDGGNVSVQFSAVPEPGSLLLGGLALLATPRRRRK